MRKVPYILIWLLFTNLFVYSQSGWFQQSPLPTGNILTSASFLNINTGYLCGYNKTIIKTNNSGINWIVLNCNVSTNYNSVFFNNFNTGYCAGDYGKIVKTTDGGNTWTTLNTGVAINLKSIYFINLNTGYVAGDSVLMRTTDQGYTWVNSRSNILDQCTFSCNEIAGFHSVEVDS